MRQERIWMARSGPRTAYRPPWPLKGASITFRPLRKGGGYAPGREEGRVGRTGFCLGCRRLENASSVMSQRQPREHCIELGNAFCTRSQRPRMMGRLDTCSCFRENAARHPCRRTFEPRHGRMVQERTASQIHSSAPAASLFNHCFLLFTTCSASETGLRRI